MRPSGNLVLLADFFCTVKAAGRGEGCRAKSVTGRRFAAIPLGLYREIATRARRLAWGMSDELSMARLNAFAAELDAQAAALDTTPHVFSHDEAAAVRSAEDDADQS
jgi:hypothetical protein